MRSWVEPDSGGCQPIVIFKELHFVLFYFLATCVACGILVPPPRIESAPPAVETQSSNHWTTREFARNCILKLWIQQGRRAHKGVPIWPVQLDVWEDELAC